LITLDAYQTLLDELVRANHIQASGQGFARRYGTDVEDPRAELRPFTLKDL
jgi:hypothetical protein